MKHTPGLWTYSAESRSDLEPTNRQVTAPHPDNGPIRKRIATVYYGETPAEREANARLIAAAPELLALLCDVGNWIECGLARGQINRGTANRDGDLVSQIRAAIAKAGGVQ